jgi:cysteine synthase
MPHARHPKHHSRYRRPDALVRINRLFRKPGVEILAKLESFNPCGSVKERIAVAMVEPPSATGRSSPA